MTDKEQVINELLETCEVSREIYESQFKKEDAR